MWITIEIKIYRFSLNVPFLYLFVQLCLRAKISPIIIQTNTAHSPVAHAKQLNSEYTRFCSIGRFEKLN